MNDDYVVLPTITETADALKALEKSYQAGAAIVLRTLAERIIELIGDLDREMAVSQCMRGITVTCYGPGHFSLDIDETVGSVDTEALAREVEDKYNRFDGFDKNLRSVQIPHGDEHEHATAGGDSGSGAAGPVGLSAAELG